jgi:hypothetical protein
MRLMYDPDDQVRGYADPSRLDFWERKGTMLDPLLRDQIQPPLLLHERFEAALAGKQNVLAVMVERSHDPAPTIFNTVILCQIDDDPKSALSNILILNTLMANNPSAVVLNLSKLFAPLHSNRASIEANDDAD